MMSGQSNWTEGMSLFQAFVPMTVLVLRLFIKVIMKTVGMNLFLSMIARAAMSFSTRSKIAVIMRLCQEHSSSLRMIRSMIPPWWSQTASSDLTESIKKNRKTFRYMKNCD